MNKEKKYNILAVEDNAENLRVVVELMHEMSNNIQALQELNAEDALDIAAMEVPDLIITDWEMPGMDGLEFIRALKKDDRTAKIPVIMCTGKMVSSENLKSALDAGAVDYIRKPIDPIEFKARIRSMLELADSFQTIEKHVEIVEAQKEALLTEVHHRVKNNLQIIISLMNLQLSKIEDDSVKKALRENQSRVMSMSLVHQRMHQTANFNAISLNSYITELIENTKYHFDESDPDFSLSIDHDLFIDVDRSIPVGLIINEIVSNFYKHCSGARFMIKAEQSDDHYILRYQDNGVGFPENISLESLDSFGMELIGILTEQLDGMFEFYNENGAVIELKLPNRN